MTIQDTVRHFLPFQNGSPAPGNVTKLEDEGLFKGQVVYSKFTWPVVLGGEEVYIWGEQGGADVGSGKQHGSELCWGLLQYSNCSPNGRGAQGASMTGARVCDCTKSTGTPTPRSFCHCGQGHMR